MPVVFVHGVAIRSEDIWPPIETFLRRYVASEISDDPDNVKMIPVFWYDKGMKFAWGGKSRPLSALLGQGAGDAPMPSASEKATLMASLSEALSGLPAPVSASGASTGLVGGAGSVAAPPAPSIRLKDLSTDQLSDLAVSVVQTIALEKDPSRSSNLYRLGTIAADEVAHDPTTLPALAAEPNAAKEIAVLQQRIEARYKELEEAQPGLIGQGASWLQVAQDRFSEALSRASDAPGFAVARVLTEARRPLNEMISRFFGDVFVYQTTRQTPQNPGPIPQRLLDGLKEAHANQQQRNGEPLIVISHSMGGQLTYDAITSFLPQNPAYSDIRVDFWVAVASQVGYFEEMKLFLAHDSQYGIDGNGNNKKAPFPDRKYLGEWWNVWDSNDFFSYTARDIFEGVDDQEYNTGMSVLSAHSGYFERPSFYREFAEKLKQARARNWSRP